MEKEKWMQEFEKKQSMKQINEAEKEDVVGELEDNSQSLWKADKTLMGRTSKETALAEHDYAAIEHLSGKLQKKMINIQ